MLAALLIAAALAEPVHAVRVQRSQYDGVCGPQDALRVRLDHHVEAVRVFWARDGQRHETLVKAPRREWLTSTILIGQVSCSDENVPADDLRAGVIFGLVAIDADGLERPVEGLPTLFDLDEIPREPGPSGVIAIALVGLAVAFGARRGFVGAAGSRVTIPRARVIV